MRGTKLECRKSMSLVGDSGKTIYITVGDKLWITTSDDYFDKRKKLKIARMTQKKLGIGWDISFNELKENFKELPS